MRTYAQKQSPSQTREVLDPARPDRATSSQNRSILQLQRTIGNQAVQPWLEANPNDFAVGSGTTAETRLAHAFSRIPVHSKSPVRVQATPKVNTPKDIYEQEAERAAEAVIRMPETTAERSVNTVDDGRTSTQPADTIPLINSLRGEGKPLDRGDRAFMEPRFGFDFSKVRIHTDDRAGAVAETLNARAFTIGHSIVFGAGEYRPATAPGRRLLAHELAHVAQQRAGTTPMVQRDLKAYNTPRTDVLPSLDPMGSSTSYIAMTAEAPGIRTALSELIAAGKIKEVKSTDGNTSWFAAEHHKNAQLDEIQAALQKAGYTKAGALARAMYDIHGEFLYTNQELTTIVPFYSRTTSLGEKIETQTNRSMTEWEIRQAKRVFGNAINYAAVTIAEGSTSAKIIAAGGYARTVGNTIYFPAGASRNMAFMVHELTHVWQYQATGWTYAPKAVWAQISEGYNYTESGKTAEQSLKDARAAGKTLYDYNKEQQGDILSDYYRRLQQGLDTSAWQPFVDDMKNK